MWPVLQQVFTRGSAALKFFVAAYFLGPEQVGLFGIALLLIALIEGVTDTGLVQAIIQSKREPSRHQLGACWTLQLLRGCFIGGVLCAVASPISILFNAREAQPIILLSALWPVMKGLNNPGVTVTLRHRKFRQVFFGETAASFIDLAVSLMLIVALHASAIAMVIGILAAELVRILISWTLLHSSLLPNFRWRIIGRWRSYGKWVWASSIIILILNNFDKLVVAKLTTPAEFGIYTVAFRVAQIAIAEPLVAFGQFLFPTLARLFSAGERMSFEYFCNVLRLVVLAALLLGALVAAVQSVATQVLLQSRWAGVGEILKIAVITMCQAGLISTFAAYFRATGRPQVVTQAVSIQLLALALSASVLVPQFGVSGAAAASAVAHGVTLIALSLKFGGIDRRLNAMAAS